MDEKQFKKGGIVLCFFLCLAIICVQSIVYNRDVRRADTTIDNLERELVDARSRIENSTRELEDSRRTLEQCYNSVDRITGTIREQSTELSGIIENLRAVRTEVENMENALCFFYVKYGYLDNYIDNNGSELND